MKQGWDDKCFKYIRKIKGFTIIEMLIIIAIIGILTAVVAPEVMRYVTQSRISTNQSNAIAIARAAIGVNTQMEKPLLAISSARLSYTTTGWSANPAHFQGATLTEINLFTQGIEDMLSLNGSCIIELDHTGKVSYVWYGRDKNTAPDTTMTRSTITIGYCKS